MGTVPASLHASLMARLDRVPGVKEVAQAAACLGREFTYPLLAAVSPLPEPELRAALDRLAAAELVFARGEPPEASYSFKHALVRRAHESLKRSDSGCTPGSRTAVGAGTEVVRWSTRCWRGTAPRGGAENSVEYWFMAGRRAAGARLAEAVGHSQALELLATLPTRRGARRRARLMTAQGGGLISAKAIPRPRRDVSSEGPRLGRRLGDPRDSPATVREWSSAWRRRPRRRPSVGGAARPGERPGDGTARLVGPEPSDQLLCGAAQRQQRHLSGCSPARPSGPVARHLYA